MTEPESLLQYITRSQKAVLDMLETEAIPRLSDEITQNFMAAQTKIMAMAKVGVLAYNLKSSFEQNRAEWDGLARERETRKYMTAVVMYHVNDHRLAWQVTLVSIIAGQNATDLVLEDEPDATIPDMWSITPMSMRGET
jgi:hypothetical protein